MEHISEFPFNVSCHENVCIPLPDGVQLAARIWLPDGAEDIPVPAILEYLPYRKRDGTAGRDALTHPYFAGHGYASVRVDIRGTGESEGFFDDEYSRQELDDALAVIDWLVAQSWCDGAVGMMGISWGGFNSLQVAALQPEALKAIITLCSTDDRFADDIHYSGGCLLNENLGWGSTMLSYNSRPPDPALVGEDWREIWLKRLDAQPLLIDTWLRHQTRNAYWQHGSVCEDFSSIKAAALAVGGWADAYSNAIPRMLAGIEAPCNAIIGPWVHKYPHIAVPEPRIGFLQEALRWWNRWLKGDDNGIDQEPDLRAFVLESHRPQTSCKARRGRWVGVHVWPDDEQLVSSWALAPGRLIERDADTGAHASVWLDISSPQTCGLDAGEFYANWIGPDLPGDQRRDDALSLVFDSAPLSEPLDILGAPRLTVTVRADQPFAQMAVRLCDVHPDGASTRITHDVLNLRHRNCREMPTPVVPGEAMTVTLQLDDIGYRIPEGHQLRLSISTSYWPLIWPTPQPVTLGISLNEARLDIPLADGATELRSDHFGPPRAAPPQRLRNLRDGSHHRTLEIDQATGTCVLNIIDDAGEAEDLDTGLIVSSIARETLSIHPDDPLSAHMTAHWTQTLRRGADWSVRTEARSKIQASATAFRITARVEAYEDETLVHEKQWDEHVPRAHV